MRITSLRVFSTKEWQHVGGRTLLMSWFYANNKKITVFASSGKLQLRSVLCFCQRKALGFAV